MRSELFKKIKAKVKGLRRPFTRMDVNKILKRSPGFLAKHCKGSNPYFKRKSRGHYVIHPKFLIVLFSAYIFSISANAQRKSVEEVWSDGRPKKVVYVQEDVIVKEEHFNENGKLTKYYNYSPTNGIKNGKFLDENGEGEFQNGQLNGKCVLLFPSDADMGDMIRTGSWKEGRPIGSHKILRRVIEQSGMALNEEVSAYVRQPIYMPYTVYSNYYVQVGSLNFSSDGSGLLDGQVQLFYGVISTDKSRAKKYYANLEYNKGNLRKVVRYDIPKRIIDSLIFAENSDSLISSPYIQRKVENKEGVVTIDVFGDYFQSASTSEFNFGRLFEVYRYGNVQCAGKIKGSPPIRVDSKFIYTEDHFYKFNTGTPPKYDLTKTLYWKDVEINEYATSMAFPKEAYYYVTDDDWYDTTISTYAKDVGEWIEDEKLFDYLAGKSSGFKLPRVHTLRLEATPPVKYYLNAKSHEPSIIFFQKNGSKYHVKNDVLYVGDKGIAKIRYVASYEEYEFERL